MPKLSQTFSKKVWGWLIVSPVLALFLCFFILPLVYTGYLSFFDAGIVGKEFVGLANLRNVLGSPLFRLILANTGKYWLCIVPASVIVPLILAVLIMELPPRWASVFRGFFYLPMAVGGVALASIWIWILNPDYGIFNYVLSLLGFQPIVWLGDRRFSIIAISIVYLATVACSNFTLIYCAAIQGLPREVIEAAKLDGAGPVSLLWFIVVPLLRPAILYVLLYTTVASARLWFYPKLFTEGGPLHSSASFGYWVYETAFVKHAFGLASMQAMLMLFFTLIFSLLLVRVKYDIA